MATLTDNAINELGTKPIGKLIAKFAAPSIVAMLVMSLYNIVDQLFIGHYAGYLGNAATNVVFPVNILTIAASMLIGEGATAVYSIKLGEGKRDDARKCAGNAIVLLSVIGVAFSILCGVFLQPLLGFFGATPAIMPHAIDYAGPIVWAIPFMFVGPGMNALIRANGSPAFAMKAMASGAIINTILDPLFIFTLGMGIKGAAIATALSQFAAFLFTLSYLRRKNGFGLARHHFRLTGAMTAKILVCGASPAISQGAIMVVIVVLNKSLVFYGSQSIYGAEIPLAAHGITMKVNQILFAFLIGISMGAQPIIGYNYGAKNFQRVKKTFLTSVALATGVGALAFCMFFFFPQTIVGLFGAEVELYNEFARKCFRTFLFFTALNGFTILSGTFFQSMARVRCAAAIQLSRQILLMVPAVHILPMYFGVEGILLCGPLTDGLSFLLALFLVTREFRRMRPGQTAEEEALPVLDVIEEAASQSTRASARIA